MQERILKTYMGTITGSLGGRNDGYPELKLSVYDTLKDAVEAEGDAPDVEFFKLVPISRKIVTAERREKRRAARKARIAALDGQIRKLTKEREKI